MSSATESPATTQVRQRPALGSPLSRLVRIGVARGHVELLQFSRERDSMVFIFGFPIILLLIFGSVFDDEIAPGVSFRQYFTAGMIASGLMITSFQSLAIQIAIERDDGTLHRLAGTPMPKGAFFLGKIILVVATATVQTMLLLTMGALFFGLDLPTDPERWVTFAWLSLLGAATFTLLGIAASGVPRSGRSASAVISPIVIVGQFISGVFFVYNDLPPWMQQIAASSAAQVADPGHAFGVPARLVRRPGASRVLGARQDRPRTPCVGHPRSRAGHADVPLAPSIRVRACDREQR